MSDQNDGQRLDQTTVEVRGGLLISMRQFLEEFIDQAGGCDHAVNVCTCAEQALLSYIDEALVARYGADLPLVFLSIAQATTGASMADGVEMAALGEKIVRDAVDRRMRDLRDELVEAQAACEMASVN